MTTVWVYTDTSKEVGDIDHLKVPCHAADRGLGGPVEFVASIIENIF